MNYRLNTLMKHVIAEDILKIALQAGIEIIAIAWMDMPIEMGLAQNVIVESIPRGANLTLLLIKKNVFVKKIIMRDLDHVWNVIVGGIPEVANLIRWAKNANVGMDTLLTWVHVKNVIVVAILKVANLIGLEKYVNVTKDMRAKTEPAQLSSGDKSPNDAISPK
ncbi:hypothetical protein TNCV_3486941 [Trichonephila clavipes]|nr:hypothetical protein TNCV_3486941 [Trichonephila clavipes]